MKRFETKDAGAYDQQAFRFEMKSLNEEAGTFAGYASVFGVVDEGDDVVLKGAFSATLAKKATEGRKVPILWSHDSRSPLGVYTALKEDDHGLWVEGKFTKGVAKAEEVRLLMKDEAVDGMSIGFRTKTYERDNDTGVRKLKEVDLFEISLCTFPMNVHSRVVSVKSENFNPRELERELREKGLTSADAVTAVAIVKKHLNRDGSDAKDAARDGQLSDLLRSIRDGRRGLSN